MTSWGLKMKEQMTILLILLCVVAGCDRQSPMTPCATSGKPEYQAPSYVPEQKLVQLAIAKLEAAGLGPKYNVMRPFYAQTPSQMGEDFVGFTFGQAKPDSGGFVRLSCIVPVNSLMGSAG
jgi:hypothetical protein